MTIRSPETTEIGVQFANKLNETLSSFGLSQEQIGRVMQLVTRKIYEVEDDLHTAKEKALRSEREAFARLALHGEIDAKTVKQAREQIYSLIIERGIG